jgi:hypothetical protein
MTRVAKRRRGSLSNVGFGRFCLDPGVTALDKLFQGLRQRQALHRAPLTPKAFFGKCRNSKSLSLEGPRLWKPSKRPSRDWPSIRACKGRSPSPRLKWTFAHLAGLGLPTQARPFPRRVMLPLFAPSKPTIEPCLARLANEPPAGPDWIHEIKHDTRRLPHPGPPQRRAALHPATAPTLPIASRASSMPSRSLPMQSCLIDGRPS